MLNDRQLPPALFVCLTLAGFAVQCHGDGD
jgi:hypothetical protein